MTEGRWRIELLGELRATREAWVVSRFRTQKTAALLAYLAFHRDRSHPREQLVEMFWPEATPEQGRNNLSQSLSSLRHQLEPPGVATGSVIVGTRATIQLNPQTTTTDVAEFHDALGRAVGATGTDRAELLASAIELHRGELLPGHYQDWISNERERLRVLCVGAARELAQEREKAGDLASALERSLKAVALDPFGEESHRDVMRLMAATGDPQGALRRAEELERWILRAQARASLGRAKAAPSSR